MIQTFFTLIDEGGWVLWPIFGVSVLSWYIGIKKLFLLRKISHFRETFFISLLRKQSGGKVLSPRLGTLKASLWRLRKHLTALRLEKVDDFDMVSTSRKVTITKFNPYHLLLDELTRNGGVTGPKQREYLFREFLANVVPELDKGLSTMSACVSIAPLLGLLGTITGMNKMFAVITDFGLGSPSLMAGGISVALESALTGLTVAVASMFFHNYLFNKKNSCIRLLMKDGEKLVDFHIG
jgi:biopolymer transport protein ExbB/TolQ